MFVSTNLSWYEKLNGIKKTNSWKHIYQQAQTLASVSHKLQKTTRHETWKLSTIIMIYIYIEQTKSKQQASQVHIRNLNIFLTKDELDIFHPRPAAVLTGHAYSQHKPGAQLLSNSFSKSWE